MYFTTLLLPLAASLAAAVSITATVSANSTTPSVTLDYCTVVAASGNDSVGYYKYQNIRYAAAPTGPLRFAKPEWPAVETSINYGDQASESVACATSEDCLFLDVWAPANSTGKNLPVLVHVYGGHFITGSKIQATPEGLFDLSKDFIFVAFNYRLGFSGMANGPSLLHQGGTSNPGVWDVTHGLEWVQKYIGAFGGDPSQVTASGFSAGASQVLFHMTRFNGHAEPLFKQAWIMSPGYVPGAGHHQAETYWQNVSIAMGCDGGNIDCMRSVNFTTLQSTASTIATAYNYTLQPRVDGDIISDTYEAQFYQKRFNFSGPAVITHEKHEENSVNTTGVTTEADVALQLKEYFPAITNDMVSEILELYPASDYEGEGYRMSDIQQSFDLTGKDLAFTQALQNETWNAIVNLGAAVHGTDQFYWWSPTYDSTLASGTVVDPIVAVQMQKYMVSFVLTGNPNTMWSSDKLYWPKYGNATNTLSFNTTLTLTTDDLANDRSLFWNKALWY